MSNKCPVCGKTEREAISSAKAIGLQKEFEGGNYTCCQVAGWADEQAFAWAQATHDDSWAETHGIASSGPGEEPTVFVYVRRKRPRVQPYRNPEDRF